MKVLRARHSSLSVFFKNSISFIKITGGSFIRSPLKNLLKRGGGIAYLRCEKSAELQSEVLPVDRILD